jgi:rhodanese-related sulfurtransferase
MKLIYRIVLGVLLALFVGLFIYLYRYAVISPYRISSEEAKQRIQRKQFDVILDVRTDLERNTLGFYPQSVHIQSADLERRMAQEFTDKNIRILAYCNTGHRARAATDKLHELGYKNALFISSTYKTLF